jgi:hypothetical protein
MSGKLTFQYPRPLSKLREEFLVTYLDNQVVADLRKTEALLTAHLIPLPIKGKNIGKEVYEIFKTYTEILLPIAKKQAKIDNISKDDLKAISANLRQLTKSLKKKKPTK